MRKETRMTPAQKRKQTIIDKYGSIEAFNEMRYHDPKKAEVRSKAAAKGGAATPKEKRGFSNPDVVRKAHEARWGK